jgi:hypothetical protein
MLYRKMRQKTAKTPLDVLIWITSHGHHQAEAKSERHKGAFVISGHSDKLIIPPAVHALVIDQVVPNNRPFDTRMYTPNAKGLRTLRKAGIDVKTLHLT